MQTQEIKPEVSIVLLSLLRQKDTQRCIESLFLHTTVPFEIIVVDMGGSEDIVWWLAEMQNRHREIIVINNLSNIGTTKGRNQGVQAARGQYIVFLDNDVEVTSDWLTPLLVCAESDKDIGACGSKIISPKGDVMCAAPLIKSHYVNGELVETGLEFTQPLQHDALEVNKQQDVTWYPTTCLLLKRDLLTKIGGFDEQLFMCEEDKDLSFSVKRLGHKVMYVPTSTVYHHHHPDNGAYGQIRRNLKVILNDIKYFQAKWKCKVFIRHTRSYLRNSGLSDVQIDKISQFSLVNTIIEDKSSTPSLNLAELIVTVTNRCNHSCSMCYYHEHLNGRQQELTLDEYKKISNSLNELKIVWISGGEPFLRKDLPEICEIFVQRNGVKSIFIPTNGSKPEAIVTGVERILTLNPNLNLTVMFSLEGQQQLHDETHGKSGAFASVEESIRRLNFLRVRLFRKNQIFGIFLNTVVSNKNQHEVIELMAYAKKNIPVDTHLLSPVRGEPKDPSVQPPSGQDFASLVQQAKPFFDFYIARGARSTKTQVTLNNRWERRYGLWTALLNGAPLPFTCQAGELIGVLEPDGGVRLCESFPQIGNVRDANYDFGAIWFSAAAETSRSRVKGCSCTHGCFIGASDKQQNSKPIIFHKTDTKTASYTE
jgi:GT2 family glycosyltransferase/MoaA/NifB/PqqE/SkfB family radical SAM enzyme